MNRTELVMRRRVFAAFVKADPVQVAFMRKPEVTKTPAGGLVRGEPIVLDPQEGRIVQAKRRYDPGLVNSEAGSIPDTQYLLLGFHTMDVAKDDEFVWRGNNYKVIGIHPTRTESTVCAIDFNGPPNG